MGNRRIDDYPTDGFPIPWATWMPDRRPQFKVHSDLGKAKNAIGAALGGESRFNPETGGYDHPIRGGVLYQMIEGKWIVRAVVQPGTYKSEHLLFTSPRKWNKQPGITTVIAENPFEV